MKLHRLFSLCSVVLLASPGLSFENYALLPTETILSTGTECAGTSEVINEYLYNKDPSQQSDIGICYAHSTVNLYAALYHEAYGVDLNPSPLMLSFYTKVLKHKLHFSKKTATQRVSGGRLPEAFENLKGNPYCPVAAVEDFLKFPDAGYSSDRSLETLSKFLRHYHEFCKSGPAGQHMRAFNLAIEALQKDGFVVNDVISQRLGELAAYVDRKGYVTSLVLSQKPRIKKTLGRFFEDRCITMTDNFIPERLPTTISEHMYHSLLPNSLVSRIKKHFTSPQSPPIELSLRIGRLQAGREGGLHSVTIYGWQCKQQRLFFLVRNSWGGMSLKKQRQFGGAFAHIPYGAESDVNGDFWLSRSAFYTSMDSEVSGITIATLRR